MEIGTIGGVGENAKHTGYAKFSTKETALYDRNGTKAAWIDQNSLNGGNVVASESIKLGRFIDYANEDGDVITKIG